MEIVFDTFRKEIDEQIKKIKSEIEESKKEITMLEKKMSHDIQGDLLPKAHQHEIDLARFDETYLRAPNSTQATPLTSYQSSDDPFSSTLYF